MRGEVPEGRDGRGAPAARDADGFACALGRDAEWAKEAAAVTARYPARAPLSYLELVDPDDPDDPIVRMCVPDARELVSDDSLLEDPLAEESLSPVDGLVHRYPDRALLFVTSECASYCRFCTRRRFVGHGPPPLLGERLDRVVSYLRAHREIREVILSGGDPLTLSDEPLDTILTAVRAVPTVDVVRIHTRIPAVLPERVTEALGRTLARHHPLYLNTHFNHARELTPAARLACRRLADAGIPLGNQTVLLAGVNDDGPTLLELFRELLKERVRPYYLHLCDPAEGTNHLRVSLDRGVELMRYLRGRLSGTAIPTLIVDLPGGHGKVPVGPGYRERREGRATVLQGPDGVAVPFPDP